MLVIYRICLTVFTLVAVEVGLDAFYPGRLFTYYQFVSLFSMIFAALIMGIGLIKLKGTIYSESLMWAGIFIVVYGVLIIFADDNSKFRFFILASGLAITIFSGNHRFVQNQNDAKENKLITAGGKR